MSSEECRGDFSIAGQVTEWYAPDQKLLVRADVGVFGVDCPVGVHCSMPSIICRHVYMFIFSFNCNQILNYLTN